MVLLVHLLAIAYIFISISTILAKTRLSGPYSNSQKPYVAERIIEGTPADTQRYPFVAGVIRLFATQAPDYFCGACITSKYWAISAEHCFPLYIEKYRLSKDDIAIVSNNNHWENGIIHEVDKWVRYGPAEDYFDIALYKVVKPFTAEFEKPIKIAADGYILREKTYVTVLGWGATHGHTLIDSKVLHGTNLKLYSDEECRNIYAAFAEQYQVGEITPLMFCAGPRAVDQRRDSCNIDSGGPIVDDDLLIGIVSWGAQNPSGSIPCGFGYPGVYVRLWKCESWIREVEAQEGEEIAQFKVNPNWLHPKDIVG